MAHRDRAHRQPLSDEIAHKWVRYTRFRRIGCSDASRWVPSIRGKREKPLGMTQGRGGEGCPTTTLSLHVQAYRLVYCGTARSYVPPPSEHNHKPPYTRIA
jgi:hypothetical protein